MAFRRFGWVLLAGTALAGVTGAAAFAQSAGNDTTDAVDCTKDPQDPECVAEAKAGQSGSTYLTPLVVSGADDAGGVGDPYAKPAAVSTVGRDEINQFGGQNLDNVLRATPGTFTHDNPQNPGISVNIRGVDSYGRVVSEIDGARQNFRFTGHDAAGMTFVDPALLSGIDITRGSADGAAGAGSLVGAANFRTLEVDDLITTDKDYGGFESFTLGTNGAGLSEAAAAAYRVNDTFAVLGAFSKRNSTDYANGDGETVPNTGQDILSGLVKAEITPTLDSRLTLSGLIYTDEFTANGYEQTIKNQTYSAKYDYAPADNELIDLHAGLYYNDTTMHYLAQDQDVVDYYDDVYGPGWGDALLDATGRVIDDKAWGINVTNTSRVALGEVNLKSTYGLSYDGDDADVVNNSASADPGVNPSGKSSVSSVFSSTTLSYGIADLTGGLRYDSYTAEGVATPSPYNPIGVVAGEYSKSGGRLDPSIRLAINPTDWLQPYVSYAETWRPPTVSELFTGGEHGGDGGVFDPNPNLEPETARTFEAGVNIHADDVLKSGDSLRLKANYYRSEIDDYIAGVIYDPGLAGYMNGNYWGSYFINLDGTSRLSGVELQAAYEGGDYFGSLAYTHTDSDLPIPDGLGVVSYVPENVFTTTLGVRLLEQRLTLGGRLSAFDETKTSSSTTLPAYKLVDLFANYRFDNGVELGLNISNVFDTAYAPSLSTTPDLDPAGGTGRGRTIEATLKSTF